MSRLIVKNLPKNVTEQSLKQLFSQKGTVTDIQLKYTADGKFRKFGFIGYQKESEAEEAIQFLNNTFINTSKITVENCSALGDNDKLKSWSKHSADSKTNKKSKKGYEAKTDVVETELDKTKKKTKKKVDESEQLLEKYRDDPLFEEFLHVHAPKESEKLHKISKKTEVNLENETHKDDEDQADIPEIISENEENLDKKIANEQISDLEYMKKLIKGDSERKPREKMKKKVKEKIQLFTVKLRNLPYSIKKKEIKDFFKPISCYTIRIPRNIHGIAYVGFKAERLASKALTKNRSFIGGKQISVAKFTEESNEKHLETREKNKWHNQEDALKNEESIGESGRIFLRNLAYTTTEEDIEKLFSKYGPLVEVNLPIDSNTKKIKGFGTVTFVMPEHAAKAFSEIDGSVLHGRMLHLLPAKSKDSINEDTEESSYYKKKKSAKQKAQAGSSHNWNSLFLGHDAVANVIAESFGTTKEAVIGPEGKGSAAVRLALGETQIVAQTRKYLEQEGVILDAFNTESTKKSKTFILVKNLPFETEAKEIREIFEKHGEVGRVILPPSGITAIVEFLEPSEARKAFTRLAYSKFKNMPLYLEWGPDESLKESKKVEAEKTINEISVKDDDNMEATNVDKTEEESTEDEEPEPDTTLFVKNLNFKTTDEGLKNHFKGCGKINYANVATKKDPKDPNNLLSMGYGFIRFVHKLSMDKALKTLQQSVLDGKSLELKRSERVFKNQVETTRKKTNLSKQTGSKILVRNVPFQANKKEIQELFSTFGEIRALRLPKKMGAGSDTHRGFAFIDYTTVSDAKAAFEALSQSTHLYGRRLVLEWAATEEGVEDIRKRTASHFKPEEEAKKSKKSVFNIV